MAEGGENTDGNTFVAIVDNRDPIRPTEPCEARFSDGVGEYSGPPADVERLFTARGRAAIAAFCRKIDRVRIEGRVVSIWWGNTERDRSAIEAALDLSHAILRESH